MSGLEMFGLVAGLLGPVQQAIETTEALIARFQAYQSTPRNLVEILSAYKQFHEDVSILRDQLNTTHTIAPKNRPIVESRILKSAQLVNNGIETLVQLQQKITNAGRLRRFFRALAHDRVLSGLKQDLEKANDNLLVITTLLCTIHALETLSDKLPSQQSNVQNQADVTRSMSRMSLNASSSSSAYVLKDGPPPNFQPSFHAPRNPSHVCLDFETLNSNNSPASLEGRVKFLACLDQESLNTSNIVSIVGMGGTGKTCTLRALAFHQDVRNRFPDGVYYISLGEEATESDFSSALREIITRVLTHSDQAKFLRYTVEELLIFLSKIFQGKTFALLVDDVQPTSPLGAQVIDSTADLLTVGDKCCMAFTTRDRKLALKGRVVNFAPREPMGETSKVILVRCAQFELDEVQDPQVSSHFDKALSICAGLPLALAIVGRAVLSLSLSLANGQRKKAWEQYLLSRQEQTTGESDIFGSVEGYRGLYTTIYTSLAALDSSTGDLTFQSPMSYKNMFLSLFILLRKDWAPYGILRRLWGLENDQQAKQVASRFTYACLADVKFFELKGKEREGITLHDLIRDCLIHERSKVDGNPASKLLDSYTHDSNGVDIPEVDCSIFGQNCRGFRQWWSEDIPDDGYFHEHIIINLFWSGRHIELYLLAVNPQWHVRRLKFGHLACDKDVGRVRSIMEAEMLVAFEDYLDEANDFISRFQSALRLSLPYIHDNIHEAPFQLEARLWKAPSERSLVHSFWTHIVFGGCDRPILIPRTPCITGSDTPLRTIIPFSETVLAMGIPTNLNFVACGLNNGEVHIVHHEMQLRLTCWKAHEKSVYSVSYIRQHLPPSTDEKVLLMTSSLDTTVKLWNVATPTAKLLRTYEGHSRSVPCVRQIPGSTNVVSVSTDLTFQKWDYNTGEKQLEVTFDDDEEVCDFAIIENSEDEGRVVTATHRRIFIWSTQTGLILSQFEIGSDGLPLRISPLDNNSKVVVAFREGFLSVWDINNQIQCGDEFWEHEGLALAVTELKNGKEGHERIVVSSGNDKKIRFWNMDTKEEICDPLSGHGSGCFQLYADEHVNELWSCAADGFRRWDLEKVLTQDRKDQCQKVEALAISRDEGVVLCGFRDGTVKVWGYVNNGWEVRGKWFGHESWVTGLATVDGDLAVSVSEDRTLRLWDVDKCSQLRCWEGLTALTRTVLVTSQFKSAITGSKDGTVLVWNLTGEEEDSLGVVHVMKAEGFVRRMHMFDNEEQTVVSVTIEGCCQVWRLSDGSLVKETMVDFGTDATLEQKRSIMQSREELLTLMGETVDKKVVDGSIAVQGNKIMWCDGKREVTLGTLESPVHDWVYSAATETLFGAAMNWNFVIADILTDEHDILF